MKYAPEGLRHARPEVGLLRVAFRRGEGFILKRIHSEGLTLPSPRAQAEGSKVR